MFHFWRWIACSELRDFLATFDQVLLQLVLRMLFSKFRVSTTSKAGVSGQALLTLLVCLPFQLCTGRNAQNGLDCEFFVNFIVRITQIGPARAWLVVDLWLLLLITLRRLPYKTNLFPIRHQLPSYTRFLLYFLKLFFILSYLFNNFIWWDFGIPKWLLFSHVYLLKISLYHLIVIFSLRWIFVIGEIHWRGAILILVHRYLPLFVFRLGIRKLLDFLIFVYFGGKGYSYAFQPLSKILLIVGLQILMGLEQVKCVLWFVADTFL